MKDFDKWNKRKKELDIKTNTKTFKERDVFFLNIWENVWYEQNWKGEKFLRPVLVYKKFSHNLFLWIPLTSKKKIWKYYLEFNLKNKTSIAILSQIKLFDSKRIEYFFWKTSKWNFNKIKEKLIELLQ